MDIAGAPIQCFMMPHKVWNQKDPILILTVMTKMKTLTVPHVDKNVAQLEIHIGDMKWPNHFGNSLTI